MEYTSRGIRNNNPFNLKQSKVAWLGKQPYNDTELVFERFALMKYGVRAGMMNLRTYINKYKCNTCEKIIERYAPSFENDQGAYKRFVYRYLDSRGYDHTSPIVAGTGIFFAMCAAITIYESGFHPAPSYFKDLYKQFKL